MGWKIHRHVQPSGRVVQQLAFYHKRTKTTHVLKGSKYKLKLSQPLSTQKRSRNIDHFPTYTQYMVTQRLTPDLEALGITRQAYSPNPKAAISYYKHLRSYIKHTMRLPNGQVITPPPLSYAVVHDYTPECQLVWKTLNKPTKE